MKGGRDARQDGAGSSFRKFFVFSIRDNTVYLQGNDKSAAKREKSIIQEKCERSP